MRRSFGHVAVVRSHLCVRLIARKVVSMSDWATALVHAGEFTCQCALPEDGWTSGSHRSSSAQRAIDVQYV